MLLSQFVNYCVNIFLANACTKLNSDRELDSNLVAIAHSFYPFIFDFKSDVSTETENAAVLLSIYLYVYLSASLICICAIIFRDTRIIWIKLLPSFRLRCGNWSNQIQSPITFVYEHDYICSASRAQWAAATALCLYSSVVYCICFI